MLAEGSGLELDKGFLLAFSPERVLVGRVFRTCAATRRSSEGSARRAADGRSRSTRRARLEPTEVRAGANAETAEMTKLVETTYRDVNIALANQYARYAARRGIDVRRRSGPPTASPTSTSINPAWESAGTASPSIRTSCSTATRICGCRRWGAPSTRRWQRGPLRWPRSVSDRSGGARGRAGHRVPG